MPIPHPWVWSLQFVPLAPPTMRTPTPATEPVLVPMPQSKAVDVSEPGPEIPVVTPEVCTTPEPKDQLPSPTTSPTSTVHIPLSVPPESTTSFDQFATQYRRCQQAEIEKQVLEHRLISTKISICLSSRLLRTGAIVQRGLVDAFKHGDKTGFVSIYNTIHDIQEACELGSNRSINRQQSFPEDPAISLHAHRIRTASFMHQLSPQSRKDLLEILTQVRTNPQFLADCITGLLPSQLSSLTTPIGFSAYGDTISSHSTARSRTSATFAKRATPNSIPFKEHAWALERSDPLSALLFNVFAVPLDWQPEESVLRLDVWSSTCAKLLSSGDNKYLNVVGQVLSYWSTTSYWQARQKIELYLMDVLQKGAFLLENIENPASHSLGVEPPDPLRTDAAEEFFESAVQTLFEVLDDSDAGLPSAALEFCNAVLNKLTDAETRDRFLEFIFVQWFFSRYLYYALTFPEGQSLLLDFHISKEAREKLLSQIALRAQSQFYRVLHSVPEFSTVNTQVRRHVDNMIKRCLYSSNQAPVAGSHIQNDHTDELDDSSSFLMLCAADVITLMNVLFPKNATSPSGSLSSNSTQPGLSYTQHSGPRRAALPAHWSGRIETVLERPSPLESIKQENTQRNRYHQCADVIRFELSDLGETEAHPVLDHPSTEDWTLLAISSDRKSLSWNTPSGNYSGSIFEGLSDSGDRSGTVQPEEDHEALHAAIQKLVNESETLRRSRTSSTSLVRQSHFLSLKERFDAARSVCESRSDFLGAHYWWTASTQLMSLSKSVKSLQNDSWILGPMLQTSYDSFSRFNTIIHECEEGLFTLSPRVEQLREYSRNSIAGMTKLRNKMWYMTDVKNSMRYEDAKHVALALKTMVYPNLHRDNTNEYRSRNGSRYLGGSFLQKPEMQVMNVMKASTSQGGPNKLSDEQVELTRKWISHHGIDNFCRGEERIHRFCYEVKSSINKLVGDSMTETPVLWASELFQRERAKFEGPSNRSYSHIPPTPGARPSSISSEEALFGMPYSSLSFRGAESLRPSDPPSLIHQSLSSEKWKYARKFEVDTLSSSGGSSGRAASSSTTESYTTFWSPSQTQAQSAASASSFQSRPPSMFSDAPAPRRTDRAVHGKTAFLDDLRQTLTSLLLSDLGSPVWSCGSETDAWFIGFLNQARVQRQMDKQARIQKFLAESEKSIHQRLGRSRHGENYMSHQRSSSADPILGPFNNALDVQPANEPAFGYKSAFARLLDVFSRNTNPYVKLGALRDLRALVVASLDRDDDRSPTPTQNFINSQGIAGAETLRLNRHSFTEGLLQHDDSFRTPTSPAPESVDLDSHPSYDLLNTSESRIITAIKDVLRELQPKTLFRDLQFVSAFVPSETLNKTDSGTAFLQFGLAALSLKEDVCASMVELADRIVSQELNRRHSQQAFDFISRTQDPIEDAARMWIITAKEGYPVAQRELAILYLTHPEILPRVTLPLTLPRDTFKAEMMYRRDRDSKFDPQSMCLALHWMQLSASGGDELARNRLREREEFESLV
uniref:Uncharacterized protein n=1 Tax=Talaromyces marneffei PM1 TaxID=1077442 RepID=A0A093V045_TALMA